MATLDTSFILKRAAAKKLEHVKTLNCWGSNLENVSNYFTNVYMAKSNVRILTISPQCLVHTRFVRDPSLSVCT